MAKGHLCLRLVAIALWLHPHCRSSGGTPEKPVGTVWTAACRDKVRSELFHFGTNREQNMLRASNMALLMLLDMLQS